MLPPLCGCACALAARNSAATAPAARSAKRLLSGLIMAVLLPPVLELSPAVHAGPSFRGRPVRDCRLADGTGERGGRNGIVAHRPAPNTAERMIGTPFHRGKEFSSRVK